MNDRIEDLMHTIAKIRKVRVEVNQREYSIATNDEKNKLNEVHTAADGLSTTEQQGRQREAEEYTKLRETDNTKMVDVINFLKTQQASVRNIGRASETLEQAKDAHREAKVLTGKARLKLIAAMKSQCKIDEVLEGQLWKK